MSSFTLLRLWFMPFLLVANSGLLAGSSTASTNLAPSMLLVDLSGSMAEPLSGTQTAKVDVVIAQLERLGQELDREPNGGAGVKVLGFTSRVALRLQLRPGAGASQEVFRFAAEAKRIVGRNEPTALWDTLQAALDEAPHQGATLTILTDGKDSASQPGGLEALLRQCAARGVRLNFVGLGEAMHSLRTELARLPGNIAQTVAVSEATGIGGLLLPPRLLVLQREGTVDVVAVGPVSPDAQLSWRVDGVARPEAGLHLRFDTSPGEHSVELQVVHPGNVLRAVQSFVVHPPQAPSVAIVPLRTAGAYIAGKRATFALSPTADALRVEWDGPDGMRVELERAAFTLSVGTNRIRARAFWANGSVSETETVVEAVLPQEDLVLQATYPWTVGNPIHVTAILGATPVPALLRVGDQSAVAALTFVPERPETYQITAEYDDEGLLRVAELTIKPEFPAFAVELTGPTELDHGQEGIFTVLVSGEKVRELRWQPQDLMQAEGERVARLGAQNETGEVVTLNLGVELVTATGRRFSRTKEVRVNPRAGRPVAALLVPGDVVRVGDALTVSCRSTGLIKRRLLAVDGGPALPLDEVKEVRFDRAGEHSLVLDIEGPGGRGRCEVKVHVLPDLVPPRVVGVSGLPARVYSKDVLRLAATIQGDAQELRWRANGRLIGALGSTTELAWTPESAGRVLLEVEALPASSAHAPASKQVTVEVKSKLLRPFYEQPKYTAGASLALLGLFSFWLILQRKARLRGTLQVRDARAPNQPVTLKLKGQTLDLKRAMQEHGWDLGPAPLCLLVLPGGEIALSREAEKVVMLEGQAVSLTSCIAATWIHRG